MCYMALISNEAHFFSCIVFKQLVFFPSFFSEQWHMLYMYICVYRYIYTHCVNQLICIPNKKTYELLYFNCFILMKCILLGRYEFLFLNFLITFQCRHKLKTCIYMEINVYSCCCLFRMTAICVFNLLFWEKSLQ